MFGGFRLLHLCVCNGCGFHFDERAPDPLKIGSLMVLGPSFRQSFLNTEQSRHTLTMRVHIDSAGAEDEALCTKAAPSAPQVLEAVGPHTLASCRPEALHPWSEWPRRRRDGLLYVLVAHKVQCEATWQSNSAQLLFSDEDCPCSLILFKVARHRSRCRVTCNVTRCKVVETQSHEKVSLTIAADEELVVRVWHSTCRL